jgi:excisionase family DNA binding protein
MTQRIQTAPQTKSTSRVDNHKYTKHKLGNVIFYVEEPANDTEANAVPVKMTRKAYKSVFPGCPDVLDVRQVSELLGVSSKTVYKLINEGVLASVKAGRAFKVPKLYLLQYLKVTGLTQPVR